MARFHCISILNIRARLNRRQCVVYSVRVLCTVRTPYFNLTVYTNIRTLLRYIQYTYISHCTNRENLYIKRANSLFVWVNQVCDARYVCAVSRAYKLIHNTHTHVLWYILNETPSMMYSIHILPHAEDLLLLSISFLLMWTFYILLNTCFHFVFTYWVIVY